MIGLEGWSKEEIKLKETFDSGSTIVINMNVHRHLLQYAKQLGKFQKIDRSTHYGNPFTLSDGTRDEICDWYENNYFPLKRSLHSSTNKLQGKVLGCHCYPKRCHGNTLVKIAEKNKQLSIF